MDRPDYLDDDDDFDRVLEEERRKRRAEQARRGTRRPGAIVGATRRPRFPHQKRRSLYRLWRQLSRLRRTKQTLLAMCWGLPHVR